MAKPCRCKPERDEYADILSDFRAVSPCGAGCDRVGGGVDDPVGAARATGAGGARAGGAAADLLSAVAAGAGGGWDSGGRAGAADAFVRLGGGGVGAGVAVEAGGAGGAGVVLGFGGDLERVADAESAGGFSVAEVPPVFPAAWRGGGCGDLSGVRGWAEAEARGGAAGVCGVAGVCGGCGGGEWGDGRELWVSVCEARGGVADGCAGAVAVLHRRVAAGGGGVLLCAGAAVPEGGREVRRENGGLGGGVDCGRRCEYRASRGLGLGRSGAGRRIPATSTRFCNILI